MLSGAPCVESVVADIFTPFRVVDDPKGERDGNEERIMRNAREACGEFAT
jgi:hypothetical protein